MLQSSSTLPLHQNQPFAWAPPSYPIWFWRFATQAQDKKVGLKYRAPSLHAATTPQLESRGSQAHDSVSIDSPAQSDTLWSKGDTEITGSKDYKACGEQLQPLLI